MDADLRFPTTPPDLPTRTRVKWENVAILLGGIVVATFAVVIVLIQGADEATTPARTEATQPAVATTEDDAPTAAGGELTMTDAVGLVEEARQFIAEARWDEAAERLSLVPDELRETSGAAALATELDAARTRHEQLRAELTAAIEARQWRDAGSLLEQLAKVAPLDAELQAQQAIVQAALAPAPRPATVATRKATPTARPATAAAATPARPAAGDGAASRAEARPDRPSAGAGRPAAATAPAATPAAGGAGGGAAAPAALDPLAAIELTPEQEAELAAALGFAAGELQ